jgi:hypothetical protein
LEKEQFNTIRMHNEITIHLLQFSFVTLLSDTVIYILRHATKLDLPANRSLSNLNALENYKMLSAHAQGAHNEKILANTRFDTRPQ